MFYLMQLVIKIQDGQMILLPPGAYNPQETHVKLF